jgi:DNA-directed RNA polymerase subunit E'/Rpb7
MLINKVIIVGLDIQNTINLHSDRDRKIMNILEEKFVGRCDKASYIKSINKVIEISDCVINQDGAPTFGTLSVRFEVTAIVYLPGEIINGCEVVNKDKRAIICATENASILLSADEKLESVQKGQKISVRVAVSPRYNIGASKMSVSAVPYLFIDTPVLYKVPPLTSDIKTYLQPVMKRVQMEEARSEEAKQKNGKAWEFFNQLLYAYKEEQKVPSGVSEIDVTKILDKFPKEIKYLSRDPRINMSMPLVYGYTDLSGAPANAKVRSGAPAKDILLMMLDDYVNHLRTVREMIEIYGSAQMLESHKNLWLIFKKAKI